MNKERRKQIAAIVNRISGIASDLEMVKDDEDEYRDNMPENLQGSTRYDDSDEASNAMQCALDALEEVSSNLEEIC